MVLQLRRKGSQDPLYAVARDVAYIYDSALRTVAGLLEDDKDPVLKGLYEAHGITMDDLGEAMGALCRFVNLASDENMPGIETALAEAGWFKTRPAARIATMYYVGTCMTATFFKGIREVQSPGDKPLASIQQLTWYMKRLLIFSRMSWWQRFCYRWLRPYRNSWWKKLKIPRRGSKCLT